MTGRKSFAEGPCGQAAMSALSFRVLAAAAAVPILLAGLTACGGSSSGPAPRASGPASAYLDCIVRHAGSAGGADNGLGPRRACKSLKPAGGLRAALQPFAVCLQSHGVALPSPSSSSAPGSPGKSIVQFVSNLPVGSPSQRAAYGACKNKL